MFHVDFLVGFEGVEQTESGYAVPFKGKTGATANTQTNMAVTGKIRRADPIAVEDFRYLRSLTDRAAKLCIPAPSTLHYRGGRNVVSEAAYPDIEEFWADFIVAYREEIAGLIGAGCSYLQFDEVAFAYLCDAEIREQVKRTGEDPDQLASKYVDVLNAIVTDRPDTLSVTMHTCRGNFLGMWRASGAYDAIAERVFGHAQVDGLFLEYDTERAGGFEPLRFVKKGTRVVLGLISTKVPQLESKDEIKRRIEEAARFVPIEDICVSPQCGFSSSHLGNPATNEDVQRRKLALLVEIADEVWGSA